jgi:Fe-S-cluster containining protein
VRELTKNIAEKLNEVSNVFGQFQKNSGLNCPETCAKCCFKADISCSPYELLPMAFHLLDTGKAEVLLEKARSHNENRCFFLNVIDESKGNGQCSEYQHRPFICRAFGLAARRGKHEITERSICNTLSTLESKNTNIQIMTSDIPLIGVWKKKLESIDPRLLEREIPIHEGLVIILERLLLWQNLTDQSSVGHL